MCLFFLSFAALCSFPGISANDILGKVFTPSCFEVKETPYCNRTLVESYEPRNPPLGISEPRTLVFLFTPTSQDAAEPLHSCGGELPPDSSYERGAQTVIIIHGWLDGVCRTYWMREMKEQLYIRGKYNVILVDWTWGNTPDLIVASQNSKVVGEQVGFVLNNIMRQTGIGPEKFHIVGHSYGAVAAGYCGRKVKGKLRRITALDPAFDPSHGNPPPKRITLRDAEIVDVIHTAASRCPVFVDGRQLGHTDFYPNGGAIQSSCYFYAVISLLKGDLLYALASLVPLLCFHLHSIQYFKVSINPSGCEFIGVESPSYEAFLSKSRRTRDHSRAIMGMDYELYHPNIKKRRKYYLRTGSICPYCATHKRNGTF